MVAGAVVDVAIGLVLIFFVFSVAVSGLYEGVAKVLAWRAKSLWAALHVLMQPDADAKQTKPGQRLVNGTPVGDQRPKVGATVADRSAVAALYAHPLVGRLEQRARDKRTRIDRIEPSNFARALIDVLVPDAGGTTSVDTWMAKLEADPEVPEMLKQQLVPLVREANDDFVTLRTNIETWFDGQMSRLTRGYRRRARYFTLAFGLVVAVACNVDAIDATRRLYRDDVTRAALVSEADAIADGCADKVGDELATCLEEAGDDVSRGAALPVGWTNADLGVLSVLGWLIAGIAIAQGAPFWYDILKRTTTYRRSRADAAHA
jgi:hypothetical protein